MAYPREILEQSRAELAARRQRSAEARAARRAQVARRVPEALALEREIASTSARLAQAVLSGEDVGAKVDEIRRFNLSSQQKLRSLLALHGFAPDALESIPSCAACRDTGVAGGQTCDCVRQLRRALMYDRLGASAPVDTYGFDRFELRWYPEQAGGSSQVSPRAIMTKTFSECLRYAKTFSIGSPSLLLTGGPGLGKTHLSLSIAHTVIERGFDVLYVPFLTLLGRLEAARFGRGGEEYADSLQAPLSCELLILDDLGSEFSTSFSTSVLYDILNSRQLAGFASVISTNLSEQELKARYGERIHSRLFGGCRVLPFLGEDIRLQKIYAR
jgi:DNA replication protein DnaC